MSIDGEIEITLKFIGVHSININLPDIRCADFYSIVFYGSNWCDYAEWIGMETDGDLVKIIADKIRPGLLYHRCYKTHGCLLLSEPDDSFRTPTSRT